MLHDYGLLPKALSHRDAREQGQFGLSISISSNLPLFEALLVHDVSNAMSVRLRL